MPSWGKSAVAPLYLLACLILGGSAQGIWQNAVLQLAGIAMIAWSAAQPGEGPLPRPAKLLLVLLAMAILIVIVQLIPVPPSIWAHGARAPLATGYQVLGQPLPWLTVSLTPYESLPALLSLIPPVAIFCVIVRLKAYRLSWLAAALLAGAIAGIVLGAMQVVTGGANPRWYPYAETNFGVAVGFFANANHMADLLVISLPFLAGAVAASRGQDVRSRSALLLALAVLTFVLVIGIALADSLAGFLLLLPVLAASAMIVLRRKSALRRIALAVAILSVVASVVALAASGIASNKLSHDANGSVQSRAIILKTTGRAMADYMPLGSGLGSFLRVYRLYERPESVTSEYVIHAHDDYAELALELGVPGVLLVLLFLAWWVAAVSAVWRNGEGGPYAQAASIASAAVLIHSLVDFPLRTAAISTCFGMFLALLADRRKPPRPVEMQQLRPVRHLVFE